MIGNRSVLYCTSVNINDYRYWLEGRDKYVSEGAKIGERNVNNNKESENAGVI